MSVRSCLTALLLLGAGGCAAALVGESPPPSEEGAAETEAVAAPETDPELTLEERWRAPFAVVASGEAPARSSREVVVLEDAAPADTAHPDPARGRIGVDSAGLSPSAGGETRTHTVVSGDSLWGIARRYGVSMDRIRELNGLEGDRVRIGQVLLIPTEGSR